MFDEVFFVGDIQINDTHLHAPLKANYRREESKLMMQRLEENPDKVPNPTRDEMMAMTCTAMENVSFDKCKAFKRNTYYTDNNLDPIWYERIPNATKFDQFLLDTRGNKII